MTIFRSDMAANLKSGDSCSKNFHLDEQIKSMDKLWEHLNTKPSIFWRHRVYPCAFIMSQHFRTIAASINHGLFWTIKSN